MRQLRTVPLAFLAVCILCIAPLMTACGRSAALKETSEEVAKALDQVSLPQVSQLGPHTYQTKVDITSKGREGEKRILEQQNLQWDGWNQYRYVIQKGELTSLDVTIWKGMAYQRSPDGKVRTRSNLEEMHYYLRQAWNPWEGVIHPFRASVVYELEQVDEREGRPVQRYHIGFRARTEPDPAGTEATRRSTEATRLEGKLWLDTATKVPLQIELSGAWKQVRFARRPGDTGEETRYEVAFQLRRYNIGLLQLSEPPEFVARP